MAVTSIRSLRKKIVHMGYICNHKRASMQRRTVPSSQELKNWQVRASRSTALLSFQG